MIKKLLEKTNPGAPGFWCKNSPFDGNDKILSSKGTAGAYIWARKKGQWWRVAAEIEILLRKKSRMFSVVENLLYV